LTRSSSIAFSTSPPASSRAALQSIIPAPVRSRSALTSAALISALPSPGVRARPIIKFPAQAGILI
jgi:hypothetical protein